MDPYLEKTWISCSLKDDQRLATKSAGHGVPNLATSGGAEEWFCHYNKESWSYWQ